MEKKCLNCECPLPEDARFCTRCGQKCGDGRVRFTSMLLHMWESTFHVDGQIIRTAWQLFIPGKITQEYFKGRQIRYPHPLRLFAVVMFFFLLLVNNGLNRLESGNLVNFIIPGRTVDEMGSDSIVRKVRYSGYDLLQSYATLKTLKSDYARMPSEWKNPGAQKVVDSLFNGFSHRHALVLKGENSDSTVQELPDTISINSGRINIPLGDLVSMDADDLLEKYKIDNWLNRILAKQTIKSIKSPGALIHAYVGSLTWTLLILNAVMAGFLGLLYWRQRRYYVEHFIFLLHLHTGILLLLTIAIGGAIMGIWGDGVVLTAVIAPAPGVYFGLKRFYRNGWIKTFIKFLLFEFFYLLVFVFAFVIGLLAVFALF